ncbi:MAG TPA: glycosyltransferase family 4 protein [Acetobacteraceae bacterium]|nr:glycosyltransferase family 4 protein [Acetobacteraceae bacterium]
MASALAEPRLHLLHRAWRVLPQQARRAVLVQGAAWLAPRPDRPAPPARAGIAVGGELDRASGLGEAARLTFYALAGLGVPVWAVRHGADPPPPGAPLILHLNAPALPLELIRLGRALVRGRRIIGVCPWELPVVPESWRLGLRFVHEVWAPSHFSAAALQSVIGAVRIVPYPVAALPPTPSGLGRAEFGLPEDAVVTLVAFNLASSFERKNPLGAIAAHKAAFGDRPDRILLIRVGNPHHFPLDFARLRAAADLPNIRIDTRILPRDDAHALMAACDIVLSLHRSEGFGLVPAEAMLLGKPVVATDWSGTQEFLDAECAALVPAALIPARDPRGVFEAPGAFWADPDRDAASDWLVRLADDPGLRARLGEAGRQAARARLGAEKLAESVRALGLPA